MRWIGKCAMTRKVEKRVTDREIWWTFSANLCCPVLPPSQFFPFLRGGLLIWIGDYSGERVVIFVSFICNLSYMLKIWIRFKFVSAHEAYYLKTNISNFEKLSREVSKNNFWLFRAYNINVHILVSWLLIYGWWTLFSPSFFVEPEFVWVVNFLLWTGQSRSIISTS